MIFRKLEAPQCGGAIQMGLPTGPALPTIITVRCFGSP